MTEEYKTSDKVLAVASILLLISEILSVSKCKPNGLLHAMLLLLQQKIIELELEGEIEIKKNELIN
jgi:hypothetical protein